MPKVCVITDTNSGITREEAKELGVYMVAMPFTVDGAGHYESISITYEEFFEKLNSGADVLTSQPSPGNVTAVWDAALKKYDEAVYIPMSSALSGACATATALAAEYDGRIQVVDNRRISLSQYYSVMDALKLVRSGAGAAKIKEILEKEALEQSIYITVNTLDLLKRSGRVTKSAAAVATVLNLKPVLQIQGGKLDAYKKARGMDKARRLMIEAAKNDTLKRFSNVNYKLALAYSGDIKPALAWKKEFSKEFPGYDIIMQRLPISICCHTGDGALACAVIKVL